MNNPYFSLIRSVWYYGASWRPTIVGYYVALIIAQLTLSTAPYTFGRTIDALQNFHDRQFHEIIFWLSAGVGVMLLFWLFHGPARVIERTVALRIQQKFRLKMYEDLTHLPLKWHQDQHSGNMLTRINRSSEALYKFAESQFIYIQAIVNFLASIGFLLWISPSVGIISLCSCLVIIAIVLLFDRKLIPLYSIENEIENRALGVLFDYVSNMTTILTLRLGQLTHSNFFQRLMAVWPFFRREAVLNEVKWFTMMSLFNISQALVLIGYIIYNLNYSGGIMIGMVVMIFRYQYELYHVFIDLSQHYGEIVRMDTDVNGIKPILKDIKRLAHLPEGIKVAEYWHSIEISNLNFHHTSEGEKGHALDAINFRLNRGERVALIGSSGSGKSTLLNLLCGLYKPSSVDLNIDGVAFKSLEPLQAITTLIPQDPEIFENTINFNITLDLPADSQDVLQIVELASFANILKTLPKGLETDIREKGLNLSVGQKQRLALARGLFAARYSRLLRAPAEPIYADHAIDGAYTTKQIQQMTSEQKPSSLLLMDEPTSSVDLQTEKEILTNIINNFTDATLIVSLHRLHLLPQFDKVIMLENGKIIASGAVTELIDSPGPVCNLWQEYQKDILILTNSSVS